MCVCVCVCVVNALTNACVCDCLTGASSIGCHGNNSQLVSFKSPLVLERTCTLIPVKRGGGGGRGREEEGREGGELAFQRHPRFLAYM